MLSVSLQIIYIFVSVKEKHKLSFIKDTVETL